MLNSFEIGSFFIFMIKYLTLRSYTLIKLYYIGEKTYVINFDVYKNKIMKGKHTLILIFISVISYTKHSILFGVKFFFLFIVHIGAL